MNILFSINQKFFSLTKICIQSMLRFDSDFVFYILHNDLSKEDENELMEAFPKFEFHFIFVNDKLLEDFPISNRYPLEIYYRLFASVLLPETLDRILYLDVDIVVISSLRDLYETDFEDNLYCACSHVEEKMTKLNSYRLKTEEVVPYINTGVLLMNLEKLRQCFDPKAILNYVENNKNRLILFDQDVLTALYGNKTKILDYRKYNLSERMMNIYNLRHPFDVIDLNWIRQNGVIIHYCGRNKPWKENYKGFLDVFYKELTETR
ncbi:glycosyltransferase family 8 protein [Floccifex sp.]|uniref:glycosyltransferase family 8 protein n=1 Tax=Floccifex sp. TaxID=2815810 RepID=UPI003F0FE0CF